MLEVARDLRQKGHDGHVTIGGHFATFEFAAILKEHPGIDSVVRHEGEETLVELCDLLARAALRCVVRPDKMQAMLLERLGVRSPERLPTPSVTLPTPSADAATVPSPPSCSANLAS